MGRAIALREDFVGLDLRRLAMASKDAGPSRRLLVLVGIYDGGRRTDAAGTCRGGWRERWRGGPISEELLTTKSQR